MKKTTLIFLLLSTNLMLCQKSISETKSYEELTKEELFQIGEVAAINSYKDEIPNTILGFFLGSIAIDAVASKNSVRGDKYKRWTKKLDIDDRIISDAWFTDGFITKRKEMVIESIRTGRLAGRLIAAAATAYILINIDDIDLDI